LEPINGDKYFDLMVKGFSHLELRETEQMTIFREGVFKLRWLSRVWFNSYITFADELDLDALKSYEMDCFTLARRTRNLMGELLVCNAVVVSGSVSEDAAEYARTRPTKSPMMSRYPVVVDLARGETHYYTGPILYGILYEKFEREYIHGHFALPLEALKGGR